MVLSLPASLLFFNPSLRDIYSMPGVGILAPSTQAEVEVTSPSGTPQRVRWVAFPDVQPDDWIVGGTLRGDVRLGGNNALHESIFLSDGQPITIGRYNSIQEAVLHISKKRAGGINIGNGNFLAHGFKGHACDIGDLNYTGIDVRIMDDASIGSKNVLYTDTVVGYGAHLEDKNAYQGHIEREHEKDAIVRSADQAVEFRNRLTGRVEYSGKIFADYAFMQEEMRRRGADATSDFARLAGDYVNAYLPEMMARHPAHALYIHPMIQTLDYYLDMAVHLLETHDPALAREAATFHAALELVISPTQEDLEKLIAVHEGKPVAREAVLKQRMDAWASQKDIITRLGQRLETIAQDLDNNRQEGSYALSEEQQTKASKPGPAQQVVLVETGYLQDTPLMLQTSAQLRHMSQKIAQSHDAILAEMEKDKAHRFERLSDPAIMELCADEASPQQGR